MGEEKKPIKRREELVRLSRDHHDGLLLCWKIRTGLKNEIAEQRILKYTLHFFESNLRDHFLQEERFVFVLLPEEDILRKKAETQHNQFYHMIATVANDPSPIKGWLQQFEEALNDHIRFEERELFNYIEETATPEALKSAGSEIDAWHSRQKPVSWPDEFWLKNVPGQ